MRKLSVTEADLRQALVHIDHLLAILPKMAKNVMDLKDIVNEALIDLQQERMRLYKEEAGKND